MNKRRLPILSRRDLFRIAGAGLIAAAARAQTAATCAAANSCATKSANGENIPSWTTPVYSGTAVASNGQAVNIPEGAVFVPGGTFVMGASNSPVYVTNADGSVTSANGDNRHKVTLSDFCISKYQITNAQFKAFTDEMGSSYLPSGPSTGKSKCYWNNPEFDWTTKGNHPVLYVSYNQSVAYCAWVAKKTGWQVTLPSEAQWERAERGQTVTGTEYTYPWGSAVSATDYKNQVCFNGYGAISNGTPKTINGNSYPYWPFVISVQNGNVNVTNWKEIAHGTDNTSTPDIDESSAAVQGVWVGMSNSGGSTTPAGSYNPSPSGCYDMAGNAFECSLDYYTISYYIQLAASTTDPVVASTSVLTSADEKAGSDGSITNPSGTPTKIVRGGSWYANEISCTTDHRTETRAAGDAGYNSVGFRIVIKPPAAAGVLAPVISPGGVVNAASGLAGVTPGAWISIFGSNLAPNSLAAGASDIVNGILPTKLGGVSVQIDGKAAFILYVSPTQINVQAPDDTAFGQVTVTVTNAAGGASAAVNVNEASVMPGWFTSGNFILAVRPSDGAVLNSASTPARPGDWLELFGTGFGEVSHPVPAGTVYSGADDTASPVKVTIGGMPATVEFAGLVGAGLYQINVQVPNGLAIGLYPVVGNVGGVSTQLNAMLAIQS